MAYNYDYNRGGASEASGATFTNHVAGNRAISYMVQGRFQEKIKGSSFVGMAATPLKSLPSCYRVKRRGDQL